MNWVGKRVLVTGADGFIGSHLTERLLGKGATVRAFVYYNAFNHWGWLDTLPEKKKRKIDIFTGDVRDPHGVEKAVEDIDVVFHLAALIGIPFSYHSPDSYVDTNIKGTLNILQAARKHRAEKVVHTSTSEIYGTAQYVPIDEKHPVNPQSPYAATKAGADTLALSFYRSFDLPVTVLRPFNTFGPSQSARAVIPTIISQLYAGKKSVALGNIGSTRDFNYVGNTVNAFLALAGEDRAIGRTFNYGSGREASIRDVFGMLCRMTGRRAGIVQKKERFRPPKSEVERLVCDAGELRSLVSLQTEVDLEAGLEKTCRWFKDNLNRYKPEIYNV